jgi:hypothetical protein
LDTWTYATIVVDELAGTKLRMYLNGAQDSTPSYPSVMLSCTQPLQIGNYGLFRGGVFQSNGRVDELRIANVARSADWVWAEWMNMASNGLFNCYGTVTNTPPSLTPYEQWKLAHFTTDELADPLVSGDDADPDRDGMGNAQEYLAGTAPKDGNSRLAFTGSAMQADGFVITWQSATGKWYVVLAATNLAAGFGESVTSHVQATPPINVHTDRPPDQAGVRFYRVDVE